MGAGEWGEMGEEACMGMGCVEECVGECDERRGRGGHVMLETRPLTIASLGVLGQLRAVGQAGFRCGQTAERFTVSMLRLRPAAQRSSVCTISACKLYSTAALAVQEVQQPHWLCKKIGSRFGCAVSCAAAIIQGVTCVRPLAGEALPHEDT